MKPLACNYAVARFLPYPETGEFVNVGVLLACPATGFFDFKVEDRCRARVHNFFPELARATYDAGLHSFQEQLRHYRGQAAGDRPRADEPPLFSGERQLARLAFAELTRPREGLFRFGPPATVLAVDPAAKLKEIFQHHVHRQFAQEREFQESVMASRLRDTLKAHRLLAFYKVGDRLGNDDYHVAVPFVRYDPLSGRPVRAIKPLDLDRTGPTEIVEHGDRWLARLRRLGDLGALPTRMLFAVRLPPPHQECCYDAALGVEDGLRRAAATEVVPERDEPGILAFARTGDDVGI